MALPHLLKFIYTQGTDEVIRRGKKIHAMGFVDLVEHDPLFGNAVFRVKDDNYGTFYKVHIGQYKDARSVSVRCACPYNMSEICRHEVAGLMRLQEMIDKGMLDTADAAYDQHHTVAKMKSIELKTLRMLCSPEVMNEADTFLKTNKPVIESAKEETVKAHVTINGETYYVILRRNEERNFDTSSDYVDEEHPLCLPKIIVFLYLLQKEGAHYFDTIRNWDKEKNKLLEAYGYSLNDDLSGKFEFNYKEGKPFLRVLDTSIKRITSPSPLPSYRKVEAPVPVAPVAVQKEVATASRQLGVVFNLNKPAYPFFSIDLVDGEMDENFNFLGPAQKLELGKYIDLDQYDERGRTLVSAVRKLQDSEVNKYINRNSPFSGFWENIVHQEGDELPEETKTLILEYFVPKLKKICAEQEQSLFVLPKGQGFKTSNLQKLEYNSSNLQPQFSVAKEGAEFVVECFVKPDAVALGLEDNEAPTPLFFLYNHQVYLWDNTDAATTAMKYGSGIMRVPADEWPELLEKEVLPLAREYKVDFGRELISEVKDGEPDVRLYLQEKGEYLVFQPVFNYKGFDTKPKDRDELVVPVGDKVLVVHRNRDAEQAFMNKLRILHSNFVEFEDGTSLALKGSDVLKNNWFFLFVDTMKEQKTPVFGFESLKNFRFNTAKPTTNIFISSHTDWFDAKVDIIFGDQRVSIAEIKKALANKQQFVQLNDGTLGILPEDWLKKYSLLFRVGEGKGNALKLSRYHLSVIDELYENRDEEELTIQLEEKYERIRDFHDIKEVPAPDHLQPILRPYQVAGFQWLNYLREVGWGGILADDMGLGKTIQALSFLQHYHDAQDGELRALVVCPTTLIYNWENEMRKFTSNLTYYIHHGPLRSRTLEALQNHNVVITTYGTLRSDIKLFVASPFDAVVLDESQAIKNPASKVTKAVALLNAKTRICMSGTPLQNNTFDIYAQMNFLNPGMLGSMEFFRQEFAIPIDKFGEPEQKDHLRKLLYPFILRRTKEQVAKDLPEKTEMVLWCEMDKEQRRIYDAYRNDYRSRIMGTIEEQGIQKSQLTILQGLMKLRQICDSPAILNEQDKFDNHSIKLDELAREISENMGDHKALIFSQFLGMLGLIREKLDSLGIKYEYFDGSTTAPDREKAIRSFQGDDEVRVFLISLKAGGVGLNLTAADYVYIVDPWWNPAVEQQAIDRTHRIGQTKNIFAYRMICKDTIEDKIMQLQERKRLLAKDLIADDSSFVKTLTREDVEYLFS